MFRLLSAAVVMLVLAGSSQAQINIFPPKAEKLEKKIGSYKKELTGYEKVSKNLYKEDFYKTWKFKNKKTGEVRSLSDFAEFDRKLFFLFTSEKLTNELEELHEQWTDDLKLAGKAAEDSKDGDDDVASKEDVEKYIKQLHDLRKLTAKRYEAYVEKLYKDYSDKFTEEEKKLYLKKMRDYHDKHKLIERSK